MNAMSNQKNENAEYEALRQEILFASSMKEKYLIATIASYATVLFWSLSNPTKIYAELLVSILYAS